MRAPAAHVRLHGLSKRHLLSSLYAAPAGQLLILAGSGCAASVCVAQTNHFALLPWVSWRPLSDPEAPPPASPATLRSPTERTGKLTYAAVVSHVWGCRWGVAVRVSIIVGSAGFLVLYLIILGDLLVGEPSRLRRTDNQAAFGLSAALPAARAPPEQAARPPANRPAPAVCCPPRSSRPPRHRLPALQRHHP